MGISLEKIQKWEKKKKAKKLLRVLHEDSTEIRVYVIRALANLEDPEIINQLVNLLRDPIPEIRLATVETLGEIGSGKAMEFIKFMLEKESEQNIIEAAKIALTKIREKTAEEESA